MAGRSASIAHAFHPHLQFMTEPGRTLLCIDHRQGHTSRLFRFGQATHPAYRPVRLPLKRKLQTIYADRFRRFHPRKATQTLFANQRNGTLICMDRVKCQSAVSRSLTGQGRASARRSGPLTRRRFSMLCIGREGGACALTTMRDRLSDGLYQQGVWARTRRLSDG
jgi:hypothetical protein